VALGVYLSLGSVAGSAAGAPAGRAEPGVPALVARSLAGDGATGGALPRAPARSSGGALLLGNRTGPRT
jgi:hypothetical protein